MNLLITLLKAAHCRSTHHHFAIDALRYVSNRRGKLLAGILLKHHQQYLLGAKDPDTRFRDFRNHVLHVADHDWGGAPAASEKWYRQLIVQLDRKRWSEAAYAAGVLSHYFTDPLMPLHTAQSEAESIVHRPMEWSINRSYARILKHFQRGEVEVVFQLADDPGWLSHAVKRAARVSHRHYTPLIRSYDLAAGVRHPEKGLDDKSIESLAGLFGLAITGLARVLERAADDCRSQIPAVGLTTAAVVATVKMPAAWITARIESSEERKAVQAIFDEFRFTGSVVENLPPEVVSVRNEYEKDRNAAGSSLNSESSATRIASVPSIAATDSKRSHADHLHAGSAIVDAPSIGPKTAKRFHAIGIDTVEKFLSQSPETIAAQIDTSWIDVDKVGQWQDQARLVCDVPRLCGYKAQLLVGVGCRSATDLSQRSATSLHATLTRFSLTPAGRRVLRSSKVPSTDDVAAWIVDAGNRGLKRTA